MVRLSSATSCASIPILRRIKPEEVNRAAFGLDDPELVAVLGDERRRLARASAGHSVLVVADTNAVEIQPDGALGQAPGEPSRLVHVTSARSGADAGAWCPYGYPTEFPPDQRAEARGNGALHV